MTREMKRLSILLAFSLGALSAQTTVYLRDNPAGFQITSCTNATPVVCTVSSVAGLSAGNFVSIAGVCASDGHYNISSANGIRKIGAVTGSTISLTDLNGNPIAGNGAWCSGYDATSVGWAPGPQFGGKVTPYSLATGVKGPFFDGDTGPVMQRWALGTQNGLVSLVCNGTSCTATTNYSHGIVAGNHLSVYNTTNPSLNKDGSTSDYTVSSATTYTFTFPSTVAAADYTQNDACGPGTTPNETIQGIDNCVRISQQAVLTNPYWNEMLGRLGGYKFYADGGSYASVDPLTMWSWYATAFALDRKNAGYLTAGMYALTNLYKLGGSTFLASEVQPGGEGGNYGLSGNPNYAGLLANAWTIFQGYLTSADRTTALGQILNDIGDPSPCAKHLAVGHDVLASGVAQSATSTSITLAASDTAANGYYVNAAIEVIDQQHNKEDATITAYNSTTKVATVSSWIGGCCGPPLAGNSYTINSTVTLSSNTSGATATVTGYFTHFTSSVHVGDFVWGLYPYSWSGENDGGRMGSWVSAVNSDTSLTVINSSNPSASSTVPQTFILGPKWTTGDCGIWWLQKHFSGNGGSQPISYLPDGGTSSATLGSNLSGIEDATWDALFLATADQDARAVTDLAIQQTHSMDYEMSLFWNYMTGVSSDGSGYGTHMTYPAALQIGWELSHSVSGFPSVAPSGQWVEGYSLYKIYSPLSSQSYNGPASPSKTIWPFYFGSQNGGLNYTANTGNPTAQQLVTDYGQAWNPTAPSSQYLKNFLNVKLGFNTFANTNNIGNIDWLSVLPSPNIVSADYTAQPLQYLFTAASHATCTALTGWLCPANSRGDIVYDHTSWSSQTGTDLFFSARTYVSSAHDWPDPGAVQLNKVGYLLANDNMPIGEDNGVPDNGTGPMFGNSTWNYNDLAFGGAQSQILRWASANHGSWATAYGDQHSNYMYAMADFSGYYTLTYNVNQRSIAHLKKPGLEEILIQYDDVDATGNATSISTHVHYPQNGETAASQWPNLSFDEGATSCPGTGGCASLNANRTILEQETGVNDGQGDPTPEYNLISSFVVPSGAPNLFIHYDGTSYPNSSGHTDRVSFCADASLTGSCGATGQSKPEFRS